MEEKKRVFWSIEEIIELQEKIRPLLGWKGYGDLSLARDNCEENDLWLFINIRKGIKIKELKRKLKKKFPKLKFEVLQQEDPTPHFLTVQLSKGELI